eukprot:1150796-Pelagomonas_calceolata.AAC.13
MDPFFFATVPFHHHFAPCGENKIGFVAGLFGKPLLSLGIPPPLLRHTEPPGRLLLCDKRGTKSLRGLLHSRESVQEGCTSFQAIPLQNFASFARAASTIWRQNSFGSEGATPLKWEPAQVSRAPSSKLYIG